MKKKPLSRLRPDQLGRLFSTVTDQADAAFDKPDERAAPAEALHTPDHASHDALPVAQPTCVQGPPIDALGTWIGRYKLVSVLGEGGMGIVYLAEQERPIRRQVALKIVKPGMDTREVIARFEAERQALALLDHPSIAHVYSAGTTEAGRPYFAMEFVSGVPITEHCDRHKLTIEERLGLFLQVCDAIQHAHQKGIIHRDIKPSNILVFLRDDQAVVKIIDFGIAKALTQPLTERTLYTEQGRFVGTPEYMSPEQAEMTAQGVDTRTDVYSLGVVLYELLAGVLPFDPDTLREGGAEHIRRVIREEDPKTPSTRLRSVSGETSTKLAQQRRTDVRALGRRLHGDLDWITLKAMAKEPHRRYATAHALAEDIQRHLHHEPVTARSPTTMYRLRKFVRRNRAQVIAGACLVVITCMGVLSVRLYRQNTANTGRLAQERPRHITRKDGTKRRWRRPRPRWNWCPINSTANYSGSASWPTWAGRTRRFKCSNSSKPSILKKGLCMSFWPCCTSSWATMRWSQSTVRWPTSTRPRRPRHSSCARGRRRRSTT
jgi:serine/threonine protein kinase